MTVDHIAVRANGLTFHVATAGAGPLVLLAHGFPELWYSWRHQIAALVDAGYRVAAPDMRGYGGSDAPEPIEDYAITDLVGDLVGLVGGLAAETAHLVGHDWGAGVAWNAALMRPDVFRTVTCMSVPFPARREGRPPVATLRAIQDKGVLGEHYMLRFQAPGVAEAEFDADIDRSFRLFMTGCSAHCPPALRMRVFMEPGRPMIADMKTPMTLPPWLSEQDLAVYVEAYEERGFRAPLNWYRNLDRNWRLTAPFQGAKVSQSALYITGTEDPIRPFLQPAEDAMRDWVPGLADVVEIAGAGHWVQQEAPEAVNQALIAFLDSHRY